MLKSDGTSPQTERLRRRALRLLQDAGNDAADGPDAVAEDLTAAEPPPARLVAAGFITMPAVFVVIVALALSVFGQPIEKPATEPREVASERLDQPPRQAVVAPIPARGHVDTLVSSEIPLSEDMKVLGMSLDGDRLALHVAGPAGAEIRIFDFEQGRIIARASIRGDESADEADSLSQSAAAPASRSERSPAAPAVKPRRGA